MFERYAVYCWYKPKLRLAALDFTFKPEDFGESLVLSPFLRHERKLVCRAFQDNGYDVESALYRSLCETTFDEEFDDPASKPKPPDVWKQPEDLELFWENCPHIMDVMPDIRVGGPFSKGEISIFLRAIGARWDFKSFRVIKFVPDEISMPHYKYAAKQILEAVHRRRRLQEFIGFRDVR
jgi:hypothetical protein